ncbi:hypothetical protein QQ008_30250 [Fulvivirgaceae bacterium BMA10]|uniref:LamG-like jellyroll fold domain-containing protein n=1 Tax=Splendidivirga corallicola TaxID=3051826 RepID=A0ABT8KY35_9BACT|nr:hypothetical protein [Fulvivirgaceae bacterium BMA10]
MRKILLPILFYLLSIGVPAHAQYKLWVDDFVFACENEITNIESSFYNGINAFLLEIEENETDLIVTNAKDRPTIAQVLSAIHQHLPFNNQEPVSLIISGNFNQDRVHQVLDIEFHDKLYMHHARDEWPTISAIKNEGYRILTFFEQEIVFTSEEQIGRSKLYSERFSSDPLGKLVLFQTTENNENAVLRASIQMWKQTGKTPNFICATSIGNRSVLRQAADSLNRLRRFRGEIKYNGELLNEIYWRHEPDRITPARFSLPLTGQQQFLVPYKNGYRLSPPEMIHHGAMEDEPRIFTAHDIFLEDKLIYDFAFDGEITNNAEPEWNNIIKKEISFINDKTRGKVLYFSTDDSYIDYSKENELDFEAPISIAAWIRPDSLPRFTSIMGLGSAFSFKLFRGNPDLTAATIKDHVIRTTIERSNWSHLAVVLNPVRTVIFFINGEKVAELALSEIKPSGQSLVIGNNIWGEQFYGAMDDLKIWNRGLSSKEIALLYQEEHNKKKPISGWTIGFLLTIVALGIIILRKRISVSATTTPKARVSHKSNMLQLFGSFQIHTQAQGDMSKAFSPLLRQILSYLVLRSAEVGDGVNTNKLTDTFWPGMSKDKAKENRGANIKKLRKVLAETGGLKVVYENRKWFIETDDEFSIDILEYVKSKSILYKELECNGVTRASLCELLDLLERGNILQNMHHEWVDHFKNKISNEVDILLSQIYHSEGSKLGPEINTRLANTILLFDNLNEQALKILIRELMTSGKHGQAQQAYKAFAKNYRVLYGEAFEIEYQDLIAP